MALMLACPVNLRKLAGCYTANQSLSPKPRPMKGRKDKMAKTTKKLQIEYVPIDQITEFKGNPRKNDEAVDAVVKSIEAFGYTNPILVRKSNYEIIAGHTRYKALRKMGEEIAPVIFLDMNETDARVYGIFDNKSTMNVEWDFSLLADALVEFDQLDVSLDLTGFEKAEIDEIMLNSGIVPPEVLPESEIKTVKCPKCGEEFEINGE